MEVGFFKRSFNFMFSSIIENYYCSRKKVSILSLSLGILLLFYPRILAILYRRSNFRINIFSLHARFLFIELTILYINDDKRRNRH